MEQVIEAFEKLAEAINNIDPEVKEMIDAQAQLVEISLSEN